jgi:hypothetical protein
MAIKDLFEQRKNYDELNTIFNYPKLPSLYTKYYLDSWYTFPLYGKVDTFGIPVMPNLSKVKYCSYGTDKNNVLVLQPMVDYFFSFREQYLDYAAAGAINPKVVNQSRASQSNYFKKDIPPIRGFINCHVEYQDKMNNLYANFINYLQNTTKASLSPGLDSLRRKFNVIKSFDSFINELMIYVSTKNSYITRAGYVESLEYSLLHTGLAVEIYKETTSNEEERLNFFNDINHDAFLELCIRNNFKIDREIPWRMYLDIRTKGVGNSDKVLSFSNLDPNTSPKIQDYIPEFKEDIQLFFDTYYTKAVPYDDASFPYFTEFVNIINNYYLFFKTAYPYYNEYKINECGKAQVGKILRSDMALFDIEYYVSLYLKFRNAELSKVVEQYELEKIYEVAMIIYKQKQETGEFKQGILSAVKYYTDNIGTLAYRNPSLYELDEQSKMP